MADSGIGSWRGSWKGWKDRTGKAALFSAILGVAVWMTAGACWAGQNLIFIVDASASMSGTLGADSKIGAVREALIDAVKTLPEDVDAGLMVFGGRRKGDCDDVAAALSQLRQQVKGFRDPTTAVIVADGRETCLGDPCEEARQLKRIYRDMVIHVIGLNVPLSDETRLVCISGNTGGRYHSVVDADGLKPALMKAVKAEVDIPPPRFKPAAGKPKAVSRVQAIEIDAGPGETRVIFSMTRPILPKVSFLRKGGPTVICDFPAARPGLDVSAGLPETPCGAIRRMTTDPDHPAGFRVKMTLASEQDYELHHFFTDADLVYHLIVRPVPPSRPPAVETD